MRAGTNTNLYAFDRMRAGFVNLGEASKFERFLAHLTPHLSTNPPKSMIVEPNPPGQRDKDSYEGPRSND